MHGLVATVRYVDREHTGIGRKTPSEGQRAPAIGWLRARWRILLAALAVTAAALALGLALFYVLDDKLDDPPSLAGAGREMFDQDTDTSDLARYCRALSDSYDPFFGTLQRGPGVPAALSRSARSPSEKHGWRVFGGMMGPVQ